MDSCILPKMQFRRRDKSWLKTKCKKFLSYLFTFTSPPFSRDRFRKDHTFKPKCYGRFTTAKASEHSDTPSYYIGNFGETSLNPCT